MTIRVRRMAEADIEQAAAVQAEAFRNPVADMERYYREGIRASWQDSWVVEADGEIGAAAVAIPATWWFAGASYNVSAIAAVGVRSVDRRRGLATQMMRAIIQADHERGRPFSLLYPFQHGYYRRLGYASVGFTHFYRLPIAQLPDKPTLRRKVRMLREADHEAVYDVYRQSLLTGAGGLERNAKHWSKLWDKTEERWVVYDDDGISGYLVYQHVERQLSIRELVTLTSEAERGLWAFLGAQVEQSRAVTYHAPIDKPLWALLREPLMFEATNRGFTLNDAAALTVSLMARLVDLPAAFARRSFDPQLSGAINLELSDPVLESNSATLRIAFDAGRAEVTPTSATATASCDIVTLTQLFCGVLRASDARWYGRLTADDAAVALLNQAFAGPTPFIHPADWF